MPKFVRFSGFDPKDPDKKYDMAIEIDKITALSEYQNSSDEITKVIFTNRDFGYVWGSVGETIDAIEEF